jgi:hypothetical protein
VSAGDVVDKVHQHKDRVHWRALENVQSMGSIRRERDRSSKEATTSFSRNVLLHRLSHPPELGYWY